MNENKIWNSIARKLADEATDEEKLVVEKWLAGDEKNKIIHRIMFQMWNYKSVPSVNSSSIYKRFKKRCVSYEQKHNFSTRFLYYALRISAILFFIVTTALLANKYLSFNEKEVVYQEIYVPKGSRSSLILPDGSKVWMSNDTKIKYPNEFEGNLRELELSGEAYFEIIHEKNRPFIVHTGQNRIRVMGTKFSVTAYPDDDILRAELISGKIMFDINTGRGTNSFVSYEVKPSHSLVWNKTSGKLFDSKISEGFYNYWQNGVYEFNNESLESLAKKIDRIYNIQIVFEDKLLKSRKFSGTIGIDDNIFTFMEAIKRTSLLSIDYKYKGNKIYVKQKK